jgi:hypothetical protein
MLQMTSSNPTVTALAALAGDWEGAEQLKASPWTVAGTVVGLHRVRLATRGLTLIQEYEQRRDGAVTLTGHGVFAVDPATSDVLWWWFDDFGHPPLTPSRGHFSDDGGIVLEKTTPRGRQRAHFAASGGLLTHRIEVAPAGSDDLIPLVDACYRRR